MAVSAGWSLIGFGHCLLEFDSGAERIHRAGELDQRAVAGQLDQSPTVAGQRRFQTLLAVFSQARERATLVATHQAGIAHHIGGNDGC